MVPFGSQSGIERDDLPQSIDETMPTSGVHEYARADRLFEDEVPAFSFVSESLETLSLAEEAPQNPSPSQASQSWIGGLLTKLKEKISTPPPKLEIPEFIPFDEQNLVTLLASAELDLEIFATIIENREVLQANALAAGMTLQDMRESEYSPLDPEMTKIWRERLREKHKEALRLTMQLKTKRLERVARNSVRPPKI